MSSRGTLLAEAYAACASLARSHYENFPVASRLLPPAMRPHVSAVYAFARVADDIADEGVVPASTRQTRLADWQTCLHQAAGGTLPEVRPSSGNQLIVVALGHTIRSLDLPLALFDDLISAFGQDTTTTRYASWSEVLDYCRRSANPVGRLVLRIAGYQSEALDRSSDALCTALQLTNFWQDFGRDWRAGRLYVPRELSDACGAEEADLQESHLTPSWARAIQTCVAATRERFDQGRAICDGVAGRLRLELRLTWLGGHHVLDRVERARFELLHNRPTLRPSDFFVLGWRTLRWPGAGLSPARMKD
ncbi:MAG: squalene synthase HpnC [Acidobacteria bacterium]|nr:MAG: squalene synthase HpnC [Acidobacteriota bacterium]